MLSRGSLLGVCAILSIIGCTFAHGDDESETTSAMSSTKKGYIILHGLCMFIAWAVLCPAAIIVARQYRKRMWWFKVHVCLMVSTCLLTLVGFIFIMLYLDWKLALSETHHTIGIIIVVGAIIQPILGWIADRLFDVKRTKIPFFPDRLHWHVGRILFFGALINMYFGLSMANVVTLLGSFSQWALAGYWLTMALILGHFIFATEVNHQRTGKPKRSPIKRSGAGGNSVAYESVDMETLTEEAL